MEDQVVMPWKGWSDFGIIAGSIYGTSNVFGLKSLTDCIAFPPTNLTRLKLYLELIAKLRTQQAHPLSVKINNSVAFEEERSRQYPHSSMFFLSDVKPKEENASATLGPPDIKAGLLVACPSLREP